VGNSTQLAFHSQTIDQENESRRRLEQAVALAAMKKEDEVVLRNKTNQKKQQVSAFPFAFPKLHEPPTNPKLPAHLPPASFHEVLNENLNQNRNLQDAVISELKQQTNAIREKKLLQQEDVYNGALEDILLGLKSEPYRRADAVRRSQRRRIDSNRYSRTLEEDF
jgi:formic-like protein